MTQDMGILPHWVPPHSTHPSGQHSMPSSSRTPLMSTPLADPQGAPLTGPAEKRDNARAGKKMLCKYFFDCY